MSARRARGSLGNHYNFSNQVHRCPFSDCGTCDGDSGIPMGGLYRWTASEITIGRPYEIRHYGGTGNLSGLLWFSASHIARQSNDAALHRRKGQMKPLIHHRESRPTAAFLTMSDMVKNPPPFGHPLFQRGNHYHTRFYLIDFKYPSADFKTASSVNFS